MGAQHRTSTAVYGCRQRGQRYHINPEWSDEEIRELMVNAFRRRWGVLNRWRKRVMRTIARDWPEMRDHRAGTAALLILRDHFPGMARKLLRSGGRLRG